MVSLGHCYVFLSCDNYVSESSGGPGGSCLLAYTDRHLPTVLFCASWAFLLGGVFHCSTGQILTAGFIFLATVFLVEGQVGVRPAQM